MSRERRLEELHGAHYAAVRAYALRRTDPEQAQDVIAEVFLIAWRRLDDVPDEALPWLYGVTRRVLANQRRSTARRDALNTRIREQKRLHPSEELGPSDRFTGDSELVHNALNMLTDRDREALLLVAWEGLEPAVAARAFGCSRSTFAVRLHRARRRFATALEAQESLADNLEPLEAR